MFTEIVDVRALIFGQSGVNKLSAVDKLASRFCALHPREELIVIHFERKIVDKHGRFPGTVVRVAADIYIYSGPICQDSKSASFKVDDVSLLAVIFFVNRSGSA